MNEVDSSSSRTDDETQKPVLPVSYGEYLSEQSSTESGKDDLVLAERTAETARSDLPANENAANAARLDCYRTKLTGHLLGLITDSDLEYGFSCYLDAFLRDRLAENALATREWLNTVFIQHYDDVSVATGVLRTVAHLEYDEVAPQGPTMALAALSHSNPEIRECGVRAFENWGTLECLKILRSVRSAEKWMQDYVTQVVADLKEEFGLHVPCRKKD